MPLLSKFEVFEFKLPKPISKESMRLMLTIKSKPEFLLTSSADSTLEFFKLLLK